ncbi:MAG: hypothetical protein ABI837_17600 [Acidobacteriota bacterium]
MRRLAFAILVLLLPIAAHSDTGMWGSRGISRRFLVRGDLVFDADGRGISVYDTSAPSQIRRVSVATTDDDSLDLAFLGSDQLALLTARSIERYSVSPAQSLSLLSTLPVTDGFTHLAASEGGSYLAAASANAVRVWAVSPQSLTTVASIPIAGTVQAIAFHHDAVVIAVAGQGVFTYERGGSALLSTMPLDARDIVVAGDTLFAACGPNGLVIANVSDDAAPFVVSRTGAGDIDLTRVAASGTHTFTVQGSDLIRIYDTALLETPRLSATFREQAEAIAANASRLFVSGPVVDSFGLRNETGVPLRVYDVVIPDAPRIVGEVRDLAGPVSGVATDGTLAYVVDPPYFRVIDVSKPSAPHELASLLVPNLQDHVKLSGDRAIVYGRGDVDLFDVSDAYHPKLLGVFVSYGRPPSNAAFAGAGNTIIEGNPWSGFHVVDFDFFGDPARPVQIAGIKGHYKEIVGRGNHAFLFGDPGGLRAVDLSARGEAKVLHELDTTAEQAEVVAETPSHPELLLSSSSDGVRVFAVDASVAPTLVVFQPLTHAVPFGSSGDTTWLGLEGHLYSLDLAGPGLLSQTAMRVSSPIQIAAAANGKIVVADRYSLRVYGPATAPPPPPKPVRSRAVRH